MLMGERFRPTLFPEAALMIKESLLTSFCGDVEAGNSYLDTALVNV